MNIVRVGKSNRSLGITLPREICIALEIEAKDYVEVTVIRPGQCTITKVVPKTLKEIIPNGI